MYVSIHANITVIDIADATAVLRAGFGYGSGLIHLDDVACTGSEAALINCTYDPITTDCVYYYEDAGVRCSPIRTSGIYPFQIWFTNICTLQVRCKKNLTYVAHFV